MPSNLGEILAWRGLTLNSGGINSGTTIEEDITMETFRSESTASGAKKVIIVDKRSSFRVVKTENDLVVLTAIVG